MGSTLLFILGIIIILTTAFDLIYTTFAPRGAGPISGAITRLVWSAAFGLCRLFSTRSLLAGTGIVVVCSIILSWVLLLWTGNTLVFLYDTDAVVDSTTNVPANNQDRIYYVGYILSTMGNGDFKAGTDAWSIYSAFVSFTGLILITIAITYMVPVLSAVTERRALSIQIASIGRSPQEMLLNYWNGEDFKDLEEQFQSLSKDIALQGQHHLAYPVLHYFHHTQKVAALLPNIVVLDEAITLLLLFVEKDRRPADKYLVPLRKAITTFIESLNETFMKAEHGEEPEINITSLKEAGLPLETPDWSALELLRYRRRGLKAMIDNTGWGWNEISQPVFDEKMDLPSMV
ncbi:MAG: potassium channel family protein [Hymenobacteraceae bacterium]|nr:potassium channel family protein [Hymenobacteraceae bacterium]MDX5481162.1 potassium channel family protein [Hymenobacteraceae bacterium]